MILGTCNLLQGGGGLHNRRGWGWGGGGIASQVLPYKMARGRDVGRFSGGNTNGPPRKTGFSV